MTKIVILSIWLFRRLNATATGAANVLIEFSIQVIVLCVHVALGDGLNFGFAEVFGFEHNALAAFETLLPMQLVSGYGRYFHRLLMLLCIPRFCCRAIKPKILDIRI
jgi:hypothetical protein